MQQVNEEKYKQMWDEFAVSASRAYLTHKYDLNNIVGLVGAAREHEIFRLLDFKPKDRVLDVGCASGRQVFRAATLCQKSWGIDIGEEFVNAARRFAEDRGVRNVEFLLVDGNVIPFPDNFFDKLICSEVLEHVPDHHSFLDEIIRVVKPGGVMVFTVPNWNSRGTLWKRLLNGFRPFPFEPLTDFSLAGINEHGDAHVRQFSLKSFSDFVKSHGLEVKYVGGAGFLDGPKFGGIVLRINRLRLMQNLTFSLEKAAARIFRSIGRHVVLKARKPF